MNPNPLLVLFSFLTLLPQSELASAHEKVIRFKDAGAAIEVPSHWQVAEDLYGLEVTVVGPMIDRFRPAISITFLNLKDPKAQIQAIENAGKQYQQGREEWLRKRKGKLKLILEPQATTTAHCGPGTRMGMDYLMGPVSYSERTYILVCGGQAFHLKTLVRKDLTGKFEAAFDSILSSFRSAVESSR